MLLEYLPSLLVDILFFVILQFLDYIEACARLNHKDDALLVCKLVRVFSVEIHEYV